MFPDRKRMPLLDLTMPFNAGYGYGYGYGFENRITAADVSSIVSCCPRLQVFAFGNDRDREPPHVVGKLPQTAGVLVPLRALSELQVLKVACVDASWLREVAGMTGLRELELCVAAADGSCGSSNEGLDGDGVRERLEAAAAAATQLAVLTKLSSLVLNGEEKYR
jgi:hypothetical protein